MVRMIYISFYFLFFLIFRECRAGLNVGPKCVQAQLKMQIQRTIKVGQICAANLRQDRPEPKECGTT